MRNICKFEITIVALLTATVFSAMPAHAASDYRLVKTSSDPKIFLVKENRRIHIPNPSVFEAGGYRWSDVKTVSQKEMDKIPNTGLIKSPVDAKVYLIVEGKKQWIPDEKTFLDGGLSWSDIVLISQAQVDFYNETTFNPQSITEIVTPKILAESVDSGENKNNNHIKPDTGHVIGVKSFSPESPQEQSQELSQEISKHVPSPQLVPAPVTVPASEAPAPPVYVYQPSAPPQWERHYVLPQGYSYPERIVFAERMSDNKWKIEGALAGSFDSEYLSAHINNKGQIATGRLVGNQSAWTRIPDLPGGKGIYIRSINDNGQAVGNAWPTLEVDANGHAFLWSNGKIKDLGAVWGKYSESTAVDINNNGQVVGYYRDREGYHGVLWENNKIIKLGSLSTKDFLVIPTAINDLGQIVGDVETEDGQRKLFMWEKGTMKEMKGFSDKKASYILADINNKGQVIGSYSVSDEKKGEGYNGIFLWENGEMRDVGIDNASVSGINNNGEIVGSQYKKGWGYYGFIWKNGETIPLNDFLPDSEIDQHNFDDSLSINDDGHIVGRGSVLNLSGNILSVIKKKPTVNIPIQSIENPKLIEIPTVTQPIQAIEKPKPIEMPAVVPPAKPSVLSAEEIEAYKKAKIPFYLEELNKKRPVNESAPIRNLGPVVIELDYTSSTYTITWEARDQKNEKGLDLYYSNVNGSTPKYTLIRMNIPRNAEKYVWDVSPLPKGAYTVHAYFPDSREYVYARGAIDLKK